MVFCNDNIVGFNINVNFYSTRNSPFRRQSSKEDPSYSSSSVTKRPPLPQRCSSVDRSMPSSSNQVHLRQLSVDGSSRPGSSCSMQLPDFLQGKQDMGKNLRTLINTSMYLGSLFN